jgi:mannose-6-phosphate isomerase-like protein (cupin superfamily)
MSADCKLSIEHDVLAPDGSEVRLLAGTAKGSMAHFTLPPRQVSLAVAHRTVEEIWYIFAGCGQMWRKSGDDESVTPLIIGLSITIPVATHFQFRNDGDEPLQAIAVTMPPWPGMEEAFQVKGKW